MTPFDGGGSVDSVAATKRLISKDDATEAARELKKFCSTKGASKDARDELQQRILERAISTFDRAPAGTTFTGWALGCAPNLLRETNARGMRGEITTGMPDESTPAATFAGRPKSVKVPAGFGRLPSGQLARGYDEIANVVYTGGQPDQIRPLQSDDVEAIDGVFILAASLITGIGDGSAMRFVDGASARWLDRIHAAYVAAYGYPAKDARWVSFASALTSALERVLLDVHDGDRELAPEEVRAELRERHGRLPEWVTDWLTDPVLRSLLDRATLAPGGRGKKNSQVLTTAVSQTVNAARKGLGLTPLSEEALNLFRPTKQAKRKTKPRLKR